MGDVGGNAVHIVPDGSIWVATGYGSLGLVRHYAVSGQVLIEWNTVLPGEQSSIPFDIAVDSAERVFIADGRVKIFTANGTLEDLIEPPLSVLTGIELASDEILYAAKTFTSPGRVQKYRRIPTSVESGTWGNIKSRYR
jgi:hypothetical protein